MKTKADSETEAAEEDTRTREDLEATQRGTITEGTEEINLLRKAFKFIK